MQSTLHSLEVQGLSRDGDRFENLFRKVRPRNLASTWKGLSRLSSTRREKKNMGWQRCLFFTVDPWHSQSPGRGGALIHSASLIHESMSAACRYIPSEGPLKIFHCKLNLKRSNQALQAINTKPQSLTYRILHHLTEEVHAHLDRKRLAVLSETSSLQLYTYFSRHFEGCIQARFHRTLQVPVLKYRRGSEFTPRSFFFSPPQLFHRLHCELLSPCSWDVCFHLE